MRAEKVRFEPAPSTSGPTCVSQGFVLINGIFVEYIDAMIFIFYFNFQLTKIVDIRFGLARA